MDRKSRGPEVTGRQVTWQEIAWTGSHVVLKSRGPEMTGTASHVDLNNRKLSVPEMTGTGSDR